MKSERRGRQGLLLVASVLAATLVTGARANAADQPFNSCLNEFWHDQPPAISVQGPLYALCASYFATLYSGRTETPLYSAEDLTAQQIEAAIHMPRDNAFHQDQRLPATVASTLEEYRDSGYDRGHMAPSGDEPDGFSQYQSFALSNMIPQNANDNRYLWAGIETAVRELVLSGRDEVFVVTGPLFEKNAPGALGGQVAIPAFIFKAVYDPAAGIAGVYVVRNAPGWQFWRLSLIDFRRRSGIDPFPGLPTDIEANPSKLPDPMHNRYAHQQD
jgi:endonuclease G